MNADELVLVTSQYKVIALRKSNGEKLWETNLVSRFFKPTDAFVALVIDDNAVYANALNEMFCLDLMTGAILWHKELGKSGWITNAGVSSIATVGSNSSAMSAQAANWNNKQRGKGD